MNFIFNFNGFSVMTVIVLVIAVVFIVVDFYFQHLGKKRMERQREEEKMSIKYQGET